jgi:hypothetical protein
MRKIIASARVSLDGVMQGPAASLGVIVRRLLSASQDGGSVRTLRSTRIYDSQRPDCESILRMMRSAH